MMLIVNGEPATLEPETAASPAFHDFLRVALIKDPATRPTAAQLLKHAWITGARPALAELVAEQEEALKKEGGQAQGVVEVEFDGSDGQTEVLPSSCDGQTLVL
jgi:serine/threonine-protein kinase 10